MMKAILLGGKLLPEDPGKGESMVAFPLPFIERKRHHEEGAYTLTQDANHLYSHWAWNSRLLDYKHLTLLFTLRKTPICILKTDIINCLRK